MSKIEKIQNLSLLFDAYNGILTDKQREVFTKYYLEDYSLSEIADELGNSKASVSDALKNTEEKLLDLDNKLKLGNKIVQIRNVIEELEKKGEEDIAKKLEEIFN